MNEIARLILANKKIEGKVVLCVRLKHISSANFSQRREKALLIAFYILFKVMTLK